jgi:hypothetical protein
MHAITAFHIFIIEGPDYRCSVAIETGEVIVGAAPRAVLRSAKVWAEQNRPLLMSTWRELNG